METNERTHITIIGWPTPNGEPAFTLTGYPNPDQEVTALAAFTAAIWRSSPDEVIGAVLWDTEFDQSRFHEAADSSLIVEDSDDWLTQNPAAVVSARERLMETVTKYLFGPNPARVDGYLNTGQFVSVFNDSAAPVDEHNDEYQAVAGLAELPELSPYSDFAPDPEETTNEAALPELPEYDRVVDNKSLVWEVNSAIPTTVEADLQHSGNSGHGAVRIHKFGKDSELFVDDLQLGEVEAMAVAMIAAVREIRSIRGLRQLSD
ncbi:hypothetical protein ABIE52_006855 [Rhodococcus sp. OAS809]|uniref:hypothetical protein n=1 Tax=Rhodococcus sp. OAS809 TaxID=2663874 RepID=UPI00178AC831